MERLQYQLAYPPRAMSAEQAAAYLSMSRTSFFRLVEQHIMPAPIKIHGMTMWDRSQLDAAFDDLHHTPGETIKQALQEWKARQDDRAKQKTQLRAMVKKLMAQGVSNKWKIAEALNNSGIQYGVVFDPVAVTQLMRGRPSQV